MIGITDERALWLGQIVLPHEPALRAWLSRRSLGGLDADDVIQESYTRLITLERVDHIRNIRTYLFQIAKSVVRDHIRSAAVVKILHFANLEAFDVHERAPSADVVASAREELQQLAEAIAALPEPTRTVFSLRRVTQLPQREISQRLGMPESTVEKHVMRALLFMKERLGRGGKRSPHASKESAQPELSEHGQGDRDRS